MGKRIAALLLAMLLWCSVALGEGEFPALNEHGFLDEGEFLYENTEEGVWRYASPTLRVEILRYTQESPAQVWYEAEIWAAEGESFSLIPNNPDKRMTSLNWPYKIARQNGTVFAINTDYAQLRYNQKTRMGIVIRDGKVYSQVTWRKGASKFPNLDVLALYPDGNMEVYDSDEKTADEYLEMGVQSTLAFGPVLIRDGVLNEAALKKYGTSSAQRTAIGMVEKGHYFAMMLEGRLTRSKGAGISFLAERMLERGCTLAFNLDGGQTACMVFMGHQLCKISSGTGNVSSRKDGEILGIGTSTLVAAEDDPW